MTEHNHQELISSLTAIATRLRKWDNVYAWRIIRAWEAEGALTPQQEDTASAILRRFHENTAT